MALTTFEREVHVADIHAKDIRAVPPERHWEVFAAAWTRLLTYRYLGKRTPMLDAGVERETMPVRHDMRNAAGGIMAAPLCIAAPEPWWRDDECVPAPVAMSYEIVDPGHGVRTLEVLREVLHVGRSMGFSRSRIVDADDHNRVIAVSTGLGISLGDVPPGFQPVENPPLDIPDSRDLPPLTEAFSAERGDDGHWRIPELRPELVAPHGALHLGPINIVLEAAAMDAATVASGTSLLQVESWTVLMVRPGMSGPFRADADVVTASTARIPVTSTLRDEGRGDQIVATASAVFRRV